MFFHVFVLFFVFFFFFIFFFLIAYRFRDLQLASATGATKLKLTRAATEKNLLRFPIVYLVVSATKVLGNLAQVEVLLALQVAELIKHTPAELTS